MGVSGRTSLRMSILNQLYKDIRAIFFTETKCKIRFVYVRFNCKRKKWGKKMDGNCVHLEEGGEGSNAQWQIPLLNFHLVFRNTSLMY